MNKERKVIETNAIVVFNGDVNASKLNELFQDFQGDIVINGSLILDKDNLCIQCDNLYVTRAVSTNVRSEGNICVSGNLYVDEDIECCNMSINGSVFCSADVDSLDINVTEDFCVENKVDTNGQDINVGGDFICEGNVDANDIVVLQSMHVKGYIDCCDIYVGGDFVCEDEVDACELMVLKKINVESNISAKSISVG